MGALRVAPPPRVGGWVGHLGHVGDGEVGVGALEVAHHLQEAALPAQHPLMARVVAGEVVQRVGDDERLRLRVLGVCGGRGTRRVTPGGGPVLPQGSLPPWGVPG